MSRASAHPHRATLPHPGSPVAVLPGLRALANLRCDADTLETASNLQTRADGTSTRGGGGRGAPECHSIVAYNSTGVLSPGATSQAKPRTHATSGTPRRVQGRPAPTRIPISREGCPGRPDAHGVPQHGTRSAYNNYGCRCPDARNDQRIYAKRLRMGYAVPAHLPAVGTARRIQALACLGYSAEKIANGTCAAWHITTIRSGDSQRVTPKIESHVKEFYRKHCDRPLPVTRQTKQVRNAAKRNGWAPPVAWDNIDDPQAKPEIDFLDDFGESSVNEEDIDLELLLQGRSDLNTNRPNREPAAVQARRTRLNRQAIQLLFERGETAAEISRRIGMVARQVERHRAWILKHQSDIAETTLSATNTEDEAPAA